MCCGRLEKYDEVRVTFEACDAVSLIAAVYEIHPAGGLAHIVVDDWNLEDDHIEFCLNEPGIDDVCRKCLIALKALTLPERVAALALHDGCMELTSH